MLGGINICINIYIYAQYQKPYYNFFKTLLSVEYLHLIKISEWKIFKITLFAKQSGICGGGDSTS